MQKLKTAWLPLLALCASCAMARIPAVTVVTGFDFSSYSAKGFMFSPDTYTGPYDAVGLLTVSSFAAVEWVNDEWRYTPVAPMAILDTLYTRAHAMGANAVVQFSIRSVVRTRRNMDIPGLELSGFAIRRRQP